jgi:hypothetical protein
MAVWASRMLLMQQIFTRGFVIGNFSEKEEKGNFFEK